MRFHLNGFHQVLKPVGAYKLVGSPIYDYENRVTCSL